MTGKRKYKVTKIEVIDLWAKHNPKVMTWLAKLQRKNESAWQLWLYCKSMSKTPEELLALKDDPRSREAEYLLDQFVAEEQLDLTNVLRVANETAKLPNSVKVKTVIAVKSFYKHNYRELAKASGSITLIKKFPYRKHTKEEMLKIHRSAQNPRDRALITFTWSTAIAKETLTLIQWKHLDPDWEKQELPHIGLPDKLLKGKGRGKYKGVEQHTFLTPEAKRDLVDYKDWLVRVKGLTLTPEDHIFVELHPPYKSVKYSTLTKVSRTLSKRSGVEFSWHDARRYVETALEEIRINPNWARKIRGRKVRGEEAPYSRPAIEQLRAKYREAVPLLQFTQPTQLMELQKRQQIVEELQAKIMAREPLTEEDFALAKRYKIRFVTRHKRHIGKSVEESKDPNDCANGKNCGEQYEEINEGNLLQYLRQGCQIVHKLEHGKVIIKKAQPVLPQRRNT